MSGHSKWSQIKRQKAGADAKKSQIFGKVSRLISLASHKGEDPKMNPDLRVAIEKAKEVNMPADNIERAIKKGFGKLEGESASWRMESVRYEAYGPGGAAIIMEGITDNKNRTTQEIKHILSNNNSSLAQTGAVIWAFEQRTKDDPLFNKGSSFVPKHPLELSQQDAEALDKLLEELDNHEDIQDIYTNAI